MASVVGVPRETFPGERCVAITPRGCEVLKKAGITVVVEPSAGVEAGYSDDQYVERGARLATREAIFAEADLILQYRSLGANPQAGRADLPSFRSGQIVIGLGEPLTALRESTDLADRGVSLFALELVPRITRAQSMDVLSSLATISGYEAVLLAASLLTKIFPMLMTAAGTITPARVFVIGAGVAGLQAIATAKRLGAVVSAYDVRAAVKDQVASVGAKFITLDVDAGEAEDKGGYAKEMSESFYEIERQRMQEVIREHDVVITTAAIPGKQAPLLVTKAMVEAMAPGSVIVDLAAIRGGNCELTKLGRTVTHNGVSILGPANLPSLAPYHASQMYSGNAVAFLKYLNGFLPLAAEPADEIVRETLVTHGGRIVHRRVLEALAAPAEGKD